MAHIEQVAEGIYRLETQIPGSRINFAVYFIKEVNSAVIEPEPAAIVPTIQAAVKDLGMSILEYIIPTHLHLDHAGAIGKLAQIFPQAKVLG